MAPPDLVKEGERKGERGVEGEGESESGNTCSNGVETNTFGFIDQVSNAQRLTRMYQEMKLFNAII